MAELTSSASETTRARGRGRGKSRGGLSKYLRARGRGRGGRPAEFHKRLVLEDEEEIDLDPDSEEAKELQKKYARRQLGSNADRYVEPEPELGSDGECRGRLVECGSEMLCKGRKFTSRRLIFLHSLQSRNCRMCRMSMCLL